MQFDRSKPRSGKGHISAPDQLAGEVQAVHAMVRLDLEQGLFPVEVVQDRAGLFEHRKDGQASEGSI